MPRFSALFLTLALSVSGCASEPTVPLRDLAFREVDSLTALPAAVRRFLDQSSEPRGIADKGEPFNVGDVVDSSKPMRRFLTAGESGNTWIVAFEEGGRGYNVQVYLFSRGVQQEHWVLFQRPTTLQDVIQQVQRTPPENEG